MKVFPFLFRRPPLRSSPLPIFQVSRSPLASLGEQANNRRVGQPRFRSRKLGGGGIEKIRKWLNVHCPNADIDYDVRKYI